jgi:hypothetical protein
MQSSLARTLFSAGYLAPLLAVLLFAPPANAQFGGDAFSAGDTAPTYQATWSSNSDGSSDTGAAHYQGSYNGSIGPQAGDTAPVYYRGATSGTIGPQASDMTVPTSTPTRQPAKDASDLAQFCGFITHGAQIFGLAVVGAWMFWCVVDLFRGRSKSKPETAPEV